jgi:hypothetical protein
MQAAALLDDIVEVTVQTAYLDVGDLYVSEGST